MQQKSREIWGQAQKNGGLFPCVKAYRGAIPPARRGIEFTTPVAHSPGHGTPLEARWVLGHTPGVLSRNNGNFAAIPVASFSNLQP